ncbi:MAG TPA: dienelactone hydrolase family protein [Vicinamibacterales bacterium]|nr:dienelactone hydrolase family protein [Vicinamibacterales bacterium]
MRTILAAGALLLVSSANVLVRTAPASAPPAAPFEDAIRAFWEADSTNEAEKRAVKVVATRAAFDDVLSRLKSGRSYGAERSGRVELPTTVRLQHLDNVAEVPAEYTPSKRWALRVSLHGGVGREAPKPGDTVRPLANRIPAGPEIVLHPRAWGGTEWWKREAVDNLYALVDQLKRRYNIDERHIYLTGISDGGTGAYFFAMRSATMWAACLPLNGHPSVLANPDTGVDGELFSGNLANCPLHAVNGGRDRLYPAASVAPLIEMFKKGGIPVSWQVYPEANHDTSWWPEERARFEAFLAAHPREAHPETVSWETERTDRYNRFRWLVIDRLGKRPSDVALPDVNEFSPNPVMSVPLFERDRPSGRVDARRTGNRFDVKTRGVQAFTLLLSPDVIDFEKPVRVTVNGTRAFAGAITRDVTALLTWAARDTDRTMLYGAELHVAVP